MKIETIKFIFYSVVYFILGLYMHLSYTSENLNYIIYSGFTLVTALLYFIILEIHEIKNKLKGD